MSDNPYSVIKPSRGASLEVGRAYHDIPGLAGPTHRKGSAARARQINEAYDVTNKTGLDLGCSVGGVSFGLAQLGATMHGFDSDGEAIKVGQEHAHRTNVPVILVKADLTNDQVVKAILTPGMYDFCIWLANWMWIATDGGYDYACDMLRKVSETVPVLFFETAQSGGSQAGNHGITTPKDVHDLLTKHTAYTNIEDLGKSPDGWMGRNVFKCS